MWYYQNGNIIFQLEIVSGLPSDPDRKTPPGIFTLNSKSSPSVLRGEMTANGTYSYEQPVTYWMPFNGGIGFHDADSVSYTHLNFTYAMVSVSCHNLSEIKGLSELSVCVF